MPGTAVRANSGFGTQAAAASAGGYDGSTVINETYEWDGTNWTTGNNMPYSMTAAVATGTQTAGFFCGGSPGSPTTSLEYDGTNWTTSAAIPTAKYYLSGSGTQTASLIFGGFVLPSTNSSQTNGYDGTAFSTRPSMGTARYGSGPTTAGTTTSTITAGGGVNPSPFAGTFSEEFTGEVETVTARTLTTS